jgi:hypothetical protein
MIYDWQYWEAKTLGIKPCQCGGAAVINEIGNSHTKKRCVEMECSKCHTKRKQCILNSTGVLSFEDLKSGVIKDWNTRPLEQELLQALKEAVAWDSHDTEGEPAVWLEMAERAIAKVEGHAK